MSITDRARAEAERQWPSYPAVGFSGAGDRQAAFIAGAEWAASLPPTDAEVEAARSVLDEYEYADEPQAIRAALVAAQRARSGA